MLLLDQYVHMQDPLSLPWDKVDTIMGVRRYCNYLIKLPSDQAWRRNQCLLCPVHIPSDGT
ncbi:hypothetical protein E2C01_040667 [Portunus trituberculatus]|uniref:Uncharacterized protein n=1 Tax=Portunus trituberculatus TaxID=210409 RepID=A0A5B7FN34_PORTR|nr:hypothetical protein [Portunus trituberculatus]